jgi:TPR repeat protein
LSDIADEHLAAKALEEGAFDEAIRLLRPLADREREYALLCLGSIYDTGSAVDRDEEVARSYYERAASQGSVEGYFGLGELLKHQGEQAQARAAFRAAAEKGHLPSMTRLGNMMLHGSGGPSDAAEGWAWLERAAAQGQVWAERRLLAIEDENARSLFKKIAVKIRIVKLALRAARIKAKDSYSEKVL